MRKPPLLLEQGRETHAVVAGEPCIACRKPIGYGRAYTVRMVDKKQGSIHRQHCNCAPRKALIDDPDDE